VTISQPAKEAVEPGGEGGRATFHSSTSYSRPSAFCRSARSLLSAASRSFSSSDSSSLLDSRNSASSCSRWSYCDLYQARAASALVSPVGGDDGGSAMTAAEKAIRPRTVACGSASGVGAAEVPRSGHVEQMSNGASTGTRNRPDGVVKRYWLRWKMGIPGGVRCERRGAGVVAVGSTETPPFAVGRRSCGDVSQVGASPVTAPVGADVSRAACRGVVVVLTWQSALCRPRPPSVVVVGSRGVVVGGKDGRSTPVACFL